MYSCKRICKVHNYHCNDGIANVARASVFVMCFIYHIQINLSLKLHKVRLKCTAWKCAQRQPKLLGLLFLFLCNVIGCLVKYDQSGISIWKGRDEL